MTQVKRAIGFLGLGVMGLPMAANLIKAGYSLIVYDIRSEAVDALVKMGAQRRYVAEDVASRSEVIITMLPDSPQVEEVILGTNGVLAGAKSGSLIIDMSSIAPKTAVKIAAEASLKGIQMLDAPVSGGEPKAMDGTLSIMVGGKEEVFEQAKEILLSMGASAF